MERVQVQDQNSVNMRYSMLSAAVVFFVSFGVYMASIAPSIAFWDCGEYTAAGHSLGIPHPPGNPLFVLLMRVASMAFFFFEDVGYRMNFAAALSSSLTAVFIYLTITQATKLFIGAPDTPQKQAATHIGGVVGGLFAAFGYTFWFSAVETSVYNFSMLNIAICTWMMLLWAQSKAADRDRLLVLVAFLGFLGIGLHMYSMIIFPSAFLFMILWDEDKRKDWRLWITGLLMASILYNLSFFIKVGPAVLLITLLMYLTSKESARKWRLCFFFSLFAIIGYSVHLFIPIRSALEPMINEGHPATWEALIGFLERQQYGSESMVRRMFWRRGYWSNQFGIDGHMGFGGFHITQFFRFDIADTERSFFAAGFIQGMAKLFLYLIPTAFMIYGWTYLFKKNKAAAVFLISLTLVTTIGMVFYMNFADGNRPERFEHEWWVRMGQPDPMPTVHREVRVRDYFFTAGFMYFGMWIGLAASCLLHALFSSRDKISRTVTAPVCAVLLAVSPVLPARSNFPLSTRANDWVPFDSAYNMLNSCEPNGIIITNGDNDTFPLWALQEAYGIRTDIRVVNLSLANTDWYNKQLRKLEPRVPMSFTESELNLLRPEIMDQPKPRGRPCPRRLQLPEAEITVTLPEATIQARGRDTVCLRQWRVQDKMVINIVNANAWERPIYFASTVSPDNYMGLGPFLRNEGLVLRIMPEQVTARNQYNLERVLALIDTVYKLRGAGDAVNNATTTRHLQTYLQIAFDMRRPMDAIRRDLEVQRMMVRAATEIQEEETDTQTADSNTLATDDPALEALRERLEEAERDYERKMGIMTRYLERLVEILHWDWRPRWIFSEFLIEHGKADEAIAMLEHAIATERDPEHLTYYESILEQAKMEIGIGRP
ncbi:MAG: DUF2723 domain-containing protein [Chitinispirillales bacterium]|nr:DUF2723 domain-containing protein [Chitinispirillales bacterium]